MPDLAALAEAAVDAARELSGRLDTVAERDEPQSALDLTAALEAISKGRFVGAFGRLVAVVAAAADGDRRVVSLADNLTVAAEHGGIAAAALVVVGDPEVATPAGRPVDRPDTGGTKERRTDDDGDCPATDGRHRVDWPTGRPPQGSNSVLVNCAARGRPARSTGSTARPTSTGPPTSRTAKPPTPPSDTTEHPIQRRESTMPTVKTATRDVVVALRVNDGHEGADAHMAIVTLTAEDVLGFVRAARQHPAGTISTGGAYPIYLDLDLLGWWELWSALGLDDNAMVVLTATQRQHVERLLEPVVDDHDDLQTTGDRCTVARSGVVWDAEAYSTHRSVRTAGIAGDDLVRLLDLHLGVPRFDEEVDHLADPAAPSATWLVVAERPDEEADVETLVGAPPKVIRFDWGRFGKDAAADDTLGYVERRLAQLADTANGWPRPVRDRLRELLKEAVGTVDLVDHGGRAYEVDWETLALRPVTAVS